ncbi:hypothetical protein MOQ_010342 [Trypanosoma cruzi marinkellei]|uniref:Uncharacterized protein n=1 Tax=Trypanosoma cruzi marinkellei TaxID=85056 RepID=K2LTB6_TRYCR|nr:hypothetical protein MOQ_010342 [Trypanosoma cruzi marinkellei]
MHAAQDPSMVTEVVAHGVQCLLLAIERESLEAVQSCAETVVQAVIHAYHTHQGNSIVHVSQWMDVLRSLIPTALHSVFLFLQRIHASTKFGSFERSVSTTLANLVFCTVTLLRRVGSDFLPRQEHERRHTDDAAPSVPSRNDARLLQMHATIQEALNNVLSSHFPFIVYNAEHQLWQLEGAASSENPVELPELHAVPHTTQFLSPLDAWIWLLVEATTSGVTAASTTVSSNDATRIQSWVTQAVLAMNPQNVSDAPFSRKFMDVIISIYSFLLKRWMNCLPGLAEALRRWNKVDAVPFFELTTPFSIRHWQQSNRKDLPIPAEICVVLHDIIRHIPVVFIGAQLLVKLQRVLSQLGVVRLFFAVQRPFGAFNVADSLSIELSRLIEAASGHIFLYSDCTRCTLLPYESSLPHLQLTFFDLASYTFERQSAEDTAALALLRPPPVCAALSFASMVRCLGFVSGDGVDARNASVGIQGDDAAGSTAVAAAAVAACRSASHAQSIVLALEEVFFCLCAFGCLLDETPSLYHFFDSVLRALRGEFEGSQMPASFLSSSVAGLPLESGVNGFTSVLNEESVKAVEYIISLYITRVRQKTRKSPDGDTLPEHRRYWLLAVSHLRMADLVAEVQMSFGVVPGFSTEYNNALCCCTPSESAGWLHLDDSSSLYEEDDSSVWHFLLKQRDLKHSSYRMSNFLFTVRDRLVAASMRFLFLALREAILLEERMERAERHHRGGRHVSFSATAPPPPTTTTTTAAAPSPSFSGEMSQAFLYTTAFTRFLLMMEYIPAARLMGFSEKCCRYISELRPAGTRRTSTHGMVTEMDLLAAQSYDLSLSLFTA